MGRIFAHVTCTRIKWEATPEEWAEMGGDPEAVEDGYVRLEDAIEEHGWIDVYWHPRILHDSRNDVRPFVSENEEDREELQQEIHDALDFLDGGYGDNGDGTFYASDSYRPYNEPWSYSYAIHFTRKYIGKGGAYVEEAWHPVKHGGFNI